MKDMLEETSQLVNYRQSVKGGVYESMYRAVDDLKINVNKYTKDSYNLLEMLFVISEFKRVIDKLSIVGLLSDSRWEVLCEMLRGLDARCRTQMDMNGEEEGE